MIFARQGYHTIVKADNCPPFQGQDFKDFATQDFKDFATQSGFRHRRITPLWPKANGEAERFVCTLKMYILATTVEEFNWKSQRPHFLRQNRATLYSTTKISPFEACTGRKKEHWPTRHSWEPSTKTDTWPYSWERLKRKGDNEMVCRQKQKKTKPSSLYPGDQDLIRQKRQNKLSSPYNPTQSQKRRVVW